LIVLWISDELRYDQFHVNGKYLYRVMENQFYTESDLQSTSATPGLLAEALKNEIPGITNSANILWEEEVLLTVGKESQKKKGRYASKEFLQMFTFPLSSGNPRTALAKSTAIVITEKLARHYFGMNDPMGKTMRVNNNEEFEVTGVLKEIPLNSSYRFDFLLTMEYYQNKNAWIKEWVTLGSPCPLLLSCLSSQTPYYARDFNYDPFLEIGAAVGPQTYGDEHPAYTVYNMVETMKHGGVPEELLAPTFGATHDPVPYADYNTWTGARGAWIGGQIKNWSVL